MGEVLFRAVLRTAFRVHGVCQQRQFVSHEVTKNTKIHKEHKQKGPGFPDVAGGEAGVSGLGPFGLLGQAHPTLTGGAIGMSALRAGER